MMRKSAPAAPVADASVRVNTYSAPVAEATPQAPPRRHTALTEASTFASRLAARDTSPRPRQMLSLGVCEEFQQRLGHPGMFEKIVFETLIDLGTRQAYRRYKDAPTTLYPLHDYDAVGDQVVETMTSTSLMRGPSDRYGKSPADTETPLPTPDW